MICIEAGVSATPYLRGGAVLRQLHRNIWKGELCLLSTCSACYPREQTHTYCRSAMSSQNTRLQSLPASSRAAYLGALPALILLMLSHGSMRVSGDACQCWDDKISGFTGGNLGTVSRSKEPLFNATLMWDVKVGTQHLLQSVFTVLHSILLHVFGVTNGTMRQCIEVQRAAVGYYPDVEPLFNAALRVCCCITTCNILVGTQHLSPTVNVFTVLLHSSGTENPQ